MFVNRFIVYDQTQICEVTKYRYFFFIIKVLSTNRLQISNKLDFINGNYCLCSKRNKDEIRQNFVTFGVTNDFQ